MKRYKLLKDLPTFKAGEEFFISDNGNLIAGTPRNPKQVTVKTEYGIPTKIDLMAYAQETLEEFPNILTDWFKEIKETGKYFYITTDGSVYFAIKGDNKKLEDDRKVIGNYFETKEEAEKYLGYLKAKEVIKQDAKGFKPDWGNPSQKRFFGYFNMIDKTLCHFNIGENMESKIFFESEEDIEESFEKHPEEWRAYLTYEQ